MIKNLVFDFGQVLVHFDPKYMTEQYVKNKEDAKLVEEVVFDRMYWDKLDLGTISDEEVLEESYNRLPARLHEVAKEVYYNWIYNIPEIDGMRDLILYLKETYDVPLYLLSNISKYFVEHKHEISILEEFDGCIFSSDYIIAKPDRRIFEKLCDEFKILPEETVFIDDNENNVKGAISFGIDTFCFQGNVDELKKWLDEKLK